MPLLERTRVEVYLPDLPSSEYQNLLRSLEEELTYAFGGSSTVKGLDGSYLSASGEVIPDRINLLYSDAPVALSTDFAVVAAYVRQLKSAAMEACQKKQSWFQLSRFTMRSKPERLRLQSVTWS